MPRRRLTERYNLPARPMPLPVLPDLTKQNAVNERLGQFPLEQEARQAQIDRANAAEAKARYDLTKQIETDRQRTAFYNGLRELEQNLTRSGYGIGTREHAEAFAAYAHEFPLARSSADVNQTLKLHAIVNDDQAALKQRMLELSPPPEKISQRYSKVQGDVAQFEAQLQGDISRQAKANAGKPDVPYNPAFDETAGKVYGALQGAKLEKAQLEQQYPQLSGASIDTNIPTPVDSSTVPTMPTQVITPESTDTTAPQVATQTVDPRVDLAQRALNDPNATEEHKAAARQILGIQEDNAE